jgi:hypothetical protein
MALGQRRWKSKQTIDDKRRRLMKSPLNTKIKIAGIMYELGVRRDLDAENYSGSETLKCYICGASYPRTSYYEVAAIDSTDVQKADELRLCEKHDGLCRGCAGQYAPGLREIANFVHDACLHHQDYLLQKMSTVDSYLTLA